MPRRVRKRLANILFPVLQPDGTYRWPGLAVRDTGTRAGFGVYTTTSLPEGTMVPIVGELVRNDREWQRRVSRGQDTHAIALRRGLVDGHPRLCGSPSTGAFRGLGVAMMVNEPTRGAPNAIFKLDYLVLTKRLPAGTQVTVHYGPGTAYARVGYTPSTVEANDAALANVRWPTASERAAVYSLLDRMVGDLQCAYAAGQAAGARAFRA